MARILGIDNDSRHLNTLEHMVKRAGHEFAGVRTGTDGIRAAAHTIPHIAFTEIELPDTSGVDVVRQLRTLDPDIACVIMTACARYDYARDALRAGASDWVDKPPVADQIASAITRALVRRHQHEGTILELPQSQPHAVVRLAKVAVQFISSRQDTPTVKLLGREVGHAAGCLRNWCQTAAIPPRSFRDFARALRAVSRLQRQGTTNDANLLIIIDSRTLRRFRVIAGGSEDRLPSTVEAFLTRQQFVHDDELVAAVRIALESVDPDRVAGVERESSPPLIA